MTHEEVKQLLETKNYDFLRTNPHLKGKILFLCLGGSHSYGTNVETSDIDIRGVAMNSATDIVGLTTFDQYVDNETDTTIYGFMKFIKLLKECNPNIIEMLFCRPDHYFYVTDLGRQLLKNRHLFLSKRAYFTFGGYARAQLNRLENALCANGKILDERETKEHINRSVQNALMSFEQVKGLINSHVGTYGDENQILVDVNLKDFPLKDLKGIIDKSAEVLRDYEKSLGHNNKKDDLHLNKHMMHLVRLYIMCNEILRDYNLHTYREKEHDLLMSIREGKFRTKEGGVTDEFYQLIKGLSDANEENYKTSILPKSADEKAVNFLVMNIIGKAFKQMH